MGNGYIDAAKRAIGLTNQGSAATLQDNAAARENRNQEAANVRQEISSNRARRAQNDALQASMDLSRALMEMDDLKRELRQKTQELQQKTQELSKQQTRSKLLLDYAAFVSCEKNGWLSSIDKYTKQARESGLSINPSSEINAIYDSANYTSGNKIQMEAVLVQKKLSILD